MSLEQQIEGVLFYKATPFKKTTLAKLLECKPEDLEPALEKLKEKLNTKTSGINLTDTGEEIELVTAAALDDLIETLSKDDQKRDIGKAGAETLAIILYKGPITRVDIDRIRGVNSAFILRNLLIRGLIEKDTGSRNTQYKITPELLSHLGIKDKTEVPEFHSIMNALEEYEKNTFDQET